MAAPTNTPLGTPDGIRLDDGFSTRITFSHLPNIALWVKAPMPPGLDNGDKIDTTTMHNTLWRTFAPRALITLTDSKMTCAYDPKVYTDIQLVIPLRQSITAKFPDGSTLDFFGFVKSFIPKELKEGEQPEADVEIVPTNFDPVNRVEAAPVMTSVGGT